MSTIRVGVDIGGTFTDIVILDEMGHRYFGKTLTTYPDPSAGFMKVLDENLKKYGFSYSDITTIIHGTTLVVNALIERKGVKTALLTTEGFRDQIEIGNENRYDLYDLFIEKPTPLVPRSLRFPVKERILADGTLLTSLDEAEVKDVLKKADAQGVEAIAVCLLHGYKNDVHEKRIYEIAQKVVPHLRVSLSSEVSPEIREYQRASTTIANVYVQPLVEQYLTKLEKDLIKRGFNGQFHLMLSGGGTCTIDTACRFPIRILESGPVGGSIAGAFYSKLCDLNNLHVFDMGGTTAKASLVDNGEPLITNEFEVGREHRFMKGSGIPVKVPVVEMIEIGAGGGSIAHIDRMDLLKVGPESASSEPGPACYGKGGTQPTITDADLILGYLNPDYFLGGDMHLDVDAAYKAIEENVAKPLGLDTVEAAWGIHRVVNENMASAARIHAVEKGKDIRHYPLFATGGAGPVHVCNVARILDVSEIISPVGAGVCSAFGFLSSPLSFDFVRSYYGRLDQLDLREVTQLLRDMENEGEAIIKQSGVKDADMQIIRTCEMRYAGQNHDISVPIPNGDLDGSLLQMIKENFKQQYETLYSEASEGVPIETVNWRVVVQGPHPRLSIEPSDEKNEMSPPVKNTREVYFNEYANYTMTPVYDRSILTQGVVIPGPAIIEEEESTMVVTPRFNITVDRYFNLILKAKVDDIYDDKGKKQQQYV
ncbi:hydantoinase/oxoprolinase family protein [Salicibibacter cibarius]|uniref:Hydantoinase/oxoprolinase family protein n=1 Tax=Salicibibacter cibarius TaxID=2743000 RepID=A0A7T7CBC2_9BACI|nr:hydantoinase/oxoprolinase family protein [Salicibibacter cibarius]QQK75740.1 hydantoinase/oxoprolinase family protein [Salicibibacter cibarius]